MKPKVAIIDYGLGNLLSVERALLANGAQSVHRVASANTFDPTDFSHLVLPGVGSIKAGMARLSDTGLIPAIRAWHTADRPLLGICLGMQMLMDFSEEDAGQAGIGIFSGSVVRLPTEEESGINLKVPHINWSYVQNQAPNHPYLLDISPEATFYFVHSYAVPADPSLEGLTLRFGNRLFVAAIARKRTLACQFHPEKSGFWGKKLLTSFLSANSVAPSVKGP